MKILHIAPDEKFIDLGVSRFEEAGNSENDVLVVTKKLKPFCDVEDLHYINQPPIFCVSSIFLNFVDFRILCESYDLVICHSLCEEVLLVMKRIIKISNPRVFWVAWGYDYLPIINENKNAGQYTENTEKALRKIWPKKQWFYKKNLTFFILRKILRLDKIAEQSRNDVINKVDFYCAPTPDEGKRIKRSFEGLDANYIDWNYGPLTRKEEGECLQTPGPLGKDIWVGFSAGPRNNHLDSFDLIEEFGSVDQRVICPLSYSDGGCYRDYILMEGRKRFGERFLPLLDFVDRVKYLEYMRHAGFFVFNTRRQAGISSANMVLLNGGKLFLDPISPGYELFKSIGAIVFSVEEFPCEFRKGLLAQSDTEHNRAVYQEHFSSGAIVDKTRRFVDGFSRVNPILNNTSSG